MKKFYWNALIKKISIKNFVLFILSFIITVIASINLFCKFGLDIVIESFALSLLFDEYKTFKNGIKEINDEYTIEEKKKDKKKKNEKEEEKEEKK
jgi:hypothetical protein